MTRGRRLLLTAWALALVAGAATGGRVTAAFTPQTGNPSNVFAMDALDPPTELTASGSEHVSLSWTATPDDYATGYRVYRGTDPGGPYTQIAEVTPRTDTDHTDSPADGTYYYVVRAFFESWESVDSNEVSVTVFTGIKVDATGSGAVDGSSLSWSHTVGEGSDRILVVGVSLRKNDRTVSSVTYGGAGGFTLAGTQHGPGADHRVEIWYTLMPEIGTATVEVTLDGNADAVGGSASFTGVHQTDPVGTFAGAGADSTDPSVDVASAAGEVVIDVLSINGDVGTLTPGDGQTERWQDSSGTGDGDDRGAASTEDGASSVTMSWTAAKEKWALGAIPLKPTTQVEPSAPSDLTAAALSSSEIDLAWTDNSFNEVGFRIERSPGGEGTWTEIATVGQNVTTYRDSGLDAETAYDYRVRAYNDTGTSAYSNVASATTDPASSGQILLDATGSGAVDGSSLSWSHTVGEGSDRILVVGVSLRKNDRTVSSVTYGGAGGFTLAGTQHGPGADHRVEIWYTLMPEIGTATVEVTLDGNADAVGGSASFTGVHQTDPVGTFAGAGADSTDPSVDVASAAGEVVIDVLSINGDVGTLTPGDGQTERWQGSSGTGDGDDRGAASTEEGASSVTMSWTAAKEKWALGAIPLRPTTQVEPSAPSDLTAAALSSSEIDLSWTDNSFNEVGFRIERSPGGEGTWTEIATVGQNVTTYRDSGLDAETAYDYRVRAYNDTGTSAYSNVASATTDPPSSGEILLDNTGSGAVDGSSLSWSHTVGSGSDRILVVGVSLRKNDRTVSSVTYGGAGGFTLAGTQHGPGADHRVEIWYKLMPEIGTATVEVTLDGNADAVGGSASFTGVHQTDPVGTFAGAGADSTDPSVDVASAAGEVVIDVLSINGDVGTLTPGDGQTERWQGSSGTGDGDDRGAASTEEGASSVTMSWTAAKEKWALGAIPLRPA